MAKGDDIEERLIRFAVRVMKVCDTLPKTPAGRHVADQLLRAGTAPAPNYGEGRSAESKRDFIHKLKIALKELNEARIWLRMVILSEMLSTHLLDNLIDECEQLCKILHSSIQTAQSRKD
ncbi:MAG: four helix bundle protein [Chloroflexota bacterium]|nr:four helix bundle protein [Chloroflexota bacterium]